jgi:protoporphyrinogen oxidase
MKRLPMDSSKTHIAVIGAGAGGLSVAKFLLENSKLNIQCDLYERESQTGGLAANSQNFVGIEKFYHHIFKSDKEVIELAKQIGVPIEWRSLNTANFTFERGILSIDTISGIFQNLGFAAGIRMMVGVLLIKLRIRIVKHDSNIESQIVTLFGKIAAAQIWKPLLSQKFGDKWKEISIKWLFSRIRDRSLKLGVIEDGFGSMWFKLEKELEMDNRFSISQSNIVAIQTVSNGYTLESSPKKQQDDILYDYVIDTTGHVVQSEDLRDDYQSAICVILKTNKTLPCSFYWLNLLPKEMFFTVAIDHTKVLGVFDSPETSYFYLARYIDKKVAVTKNNVKEKSKLAKIAESELRLILASEVIHDFSIEDYEVHIAINAQPIFSKENIKRIRMNDRGADLFGINLWNTFPHDRGQNYAIAEARKVATLINLEIQKQPSKDQERM